MAANVFSLEHRDDTQSEIKVVEDSEGNVEFEGLPNQFAYSMNVFTNEEKKNTPLECLSAAIREREGIGKKNAEPEPQDGEQKYVPSDSEVKKMLNFDLKEDDPSKYYDIIERIGIGGFAKVFKVKRKSDDQFMALKFVEPRN